MPSKANRAGGIDRRRRADTPETTSKAPPSLSDPAALRAFVEEIDEAIYVADAAGGIIDGNSALIRILAASSIEQLRSRRLVDFLIEQADRDALEGLLERGEDVGGLELKIRALDDQPRWIRNSALTLRDAEGKVVAYQGMLIDVTEHRLTLRALSNSEEKYRAIFENVPDIYYRTDLDGTIIEVSPAVKRFLGYERKELIGRAADDLYHHSGTRQVLRDRVLEEGEVTGFEVNLQHKDGTTGWFSVNARLVEDDHGRPTALEGLLRDITARKELERRLEELSVRDPLTGCYNRRFLDRLRTELERPTAHWGCLMLDLDDFKTVNDTYGHDEGDRVLQGVAHFIRRHGRAEDVLVRLGGDEFAVFVSAGSPEELEGIAGRLRDVSPYESPAAFSLGCAFREVGERIEDVIARADESMYRAKGSGSKRVNDDRAPR